MRYLAMGCNAFPNDCAICLYVAKLTDKNIPARCNTHTLPHDGPAPNRKYGAVVCIGNRQRRSYLFF